ncbi:hypothetical protein BDZ91DRAFT_60670 [Kalaharituber pfeilii]|nr:hypothetical protein BDZ91DRAFT_60670 [Kalaharituber pfeilii]
MPLAWGAQRGACPLAGLHSRSTAADAATDRDAMDCTRVGASAARRLPSVDVGGPQLPRQAPRALCCVLRAACCEQQRCRFGCSLDCLARSRVRARSTAT